MAEMTAKRQGEMVRCLFGILDDEPEGLKAKEAITRVQGSLTLTPFETATFPNNPGVVRFPRILRFSTSKSVKAGWLRKAKGVWSLTEEGRTALTTFTDPEAFFRESGRLYREWKASQPSPTDEQQEIEDVDGSTDKGLLAATTLEEAEEAARRDILDFMATLNPYRFQDLVGKLLGAMGYHVVWIAPRGKDGGLDLIAQGDPLGVNGPRMKGQVKRRPGQKTTEEELRSFMSLIEPHDVGVYISLGGYTSDAESHSRRTSRRITLLDGEQLLDLWIAHYPQVDNEGKGILPIRPVHFLNAEAASD